MEMSSISIFEKCLLDTVCFERVVIMVILARRDGENTLYGELYR